ncbi:hypothetical protein D3C76_1779050 [compost metagenome]
MAVGEQAGGADSIVPLESEEVHGVRIFGVPFQFRRNGLLGDEYGLTDAAQVGIVLLPVGNTDVYLTHRQTPDFLA